MIPAVRIMEFILNSYRLYEERIDISISLNNTSSDRYVFPLKDFHAMLFSIADKNHVYKWSSSCFSTRMKSPIILKPYENYRCNSVLRIKNFYNKERTSISEGQYNVWAKLKIDTDYFDPFSHLRFRHLCNIAKLSDAKVWTGTIISNKLSIPLLETDINADWKAILLEKANMAEAYYGVSEIPCMKAGCDMNRLNERFYCSHHDVGLK